MSFLRMCWGNQKWCGGPILMLLPRLDIADAGRLGRILYYTISFFKKNPQIPLPRPSWSAYSQTRKDLYRWGIGQANSWSTFLLFISASSSKGTYHKPNFSPLAGTWIGWTIPWKFHPIPKPGSNPFWRITLAIILYTTRIRGCGPNLLWWYLPAPPCRNHSLERLHQWSRMPIGMASLTMNNPLLILPNKFH